MSLSVLVLTELAIRADVTFCCAVRGLSRDCAKVHVFVGDQSNQQTSCYCKLLMYDESDENSTNL
jgi:hypothetical protein